MRDRRAGGAYRRVGQKDVARAVKPAVKLAEPRVIPASCGMSKEESRENLLDLRRTDIRHGSWGGVVSGTEAEGDQREGIDSSGGLQFLVGLEAFEGIDRILVPDAISLLRLKVATEGQSALNFLIAIRGWR